MRTRLFMVPFLCFCLLQLGALNSALALDEAGPSEPVQRPVKPGESSASSKPEISPVRSDRLHGNVRGEALPTDVGLKKLAEAAGAVDRGAGLVAAEVTRKEYLQMRGPNVLPNGIVIQPMPSPSGLVPAGSLPPRERRLRIANQQLAYQIELLHNAMDALIIPASKESQATDLWRKMREDVANIESHFAKLQALSSEPPFDSMKIGREALAIHDLSGRFNRNRKQLAALIRQQDSR